MLAFYFGVSLGKSYTFNFACFLIENFKQVCNLFHKIIIKLKPFPSNQKISIKISIDQIVTETIILENRKNIKTQPLLFLVAKLSYNTCILYCQFVCLFIGNEYVMQSLQELKHSKHTHNHIEMPLKICL